MPRRFRPDSGALIRTNPATPLCPRADGHEATGSFLPSAVRGRAPFGGAFVQIKADMWR